MPTAAPASRYTGRLTAVCSYCGDHYGSRPCIPEMDGKETHGICPACAIATAAHFDRDLRCTCRLSTPAPQ